MRLPHVAISLLCALSCAEQLGRRPALQARQDNVATTTDDVASTTPPDQSVVTSTPTISPTRTRETENAPTTTQISGDGEVTSAITAVPIPTSIATNSTSNGTIPNGSDSDSNQLPIKPVISPALGVAGALLMISGLVLALVGIKHRPTQTFLSTSLLIALSIEVLIIYLMRPPVSNTVQGAYVIAGALGGCALGALALIFREVSEGFGCLLGGFCLAMWLLVLSPGGVIKNHVGKIIMIGLFCAAASSLYISRFTRVYGIIACTAFAGATAFIIGLDCFSRAGLKEFWMYIWDVNSDVFPLFTDTYPINRNMRAEIAAIIIITFFGILSQIKIWQIVKEQKAKREADRLAEQAARDAEETEVGRDIEAQVARERGNWEGTYETKKMADVHVGSVSESEKGSNSYEMSSSGMSERYCPFPVPNSDSAATDGSGHRPALSSPQSASSLNVPFADSSNRRASPGPGLPPLGFDFENGVPTTNAASPSTRASSSASPALGISQAGSNASSTVDVHLGERRTDASLSAQNAVDDEQFPMEEEDDDIASSIAATAAEAPDMDALSMRLSRPTSMYMSHDHDTHHAPTSQDFLVEDDDEALCLPGNKPDEASRAGSPKPPGSLHTGDESYFSGETTDDAGGQANLKERLPKKMSKAASSYRLNEWAKEVSRAEAMPVEEVEEHTTDAVQVETTDAAAAARAEENNAIPVPPAPPKPKQVARAASKAENLGRSSRHLSRMPSGIAATPVYAHSSRGSEDSWNVPLAKRMSSNPAFISKDPIAEEAIRHVSSSDVLSGQRFLPSPTQQLHSAPSKATYPPEAAQNEETKSADLLSGQRSSPSPSPTQQQQQLSPPSPKTNLVPEAAQPTSPKNIARTQSKDRLSQMPRSMSSMSNLLDARQDRLDARLTTTSFMTPRIDVPPGPASPSSGRSITKPDGSQGNPSSNSSISDAAGLPLDASQDEDMTLSERKALVQRKSMLTLQQQQNAAAAHADSQQRRISSRNEILDPYRTSLISPTKQQQQQQIRMSNPLYDSHQPRRASSHNVVKQALNWNQWRDSTAQAGAQRSPIVTSDAHGDMLRAARIQAEAEAKRKELLLKRKQEQMDQHMRMGGLHDAHRAALARMQRKVKE